MKDRVFYAATGQPLVTAGQVAKIIKSIIPSADIEIGLGLSEDDQIKIRYRGILSIQNTREQLGYEPQYMDIKTGLCDYIEQYRRYIKETVHTHSSIY